MNLFSTDSFIV